MFSLVVVIDLVVGKETVKVVGLVVTKMAIAKDFETSVETILMVVEVLVLNLNVA